MKKFSLLLVLGCSIISLNAMKALKECAGALRRTALSQCYSKPYSVVTDYKGFSCNDVDDILSMYHEYGNKHFINYLQNASNDQIDHVQFQVNGEFRRCGNYGSVPDEALFKMYKLVFIIKSLRDHDAALDWSRKHVSEYQ